MPKIKIHPYLDVEVVARARATVAALRDDVPEARSINELVTWGLQLACDYLERTHHEGRPYPLVDEMPGSGGLRRPDGPRPDGSGLRG